MDVNVTRLCNINERILEFNMCSLSQPSFLPRRTKFLGRGKIVNNISLDRNHRYYYFYWIDYN